VAVVDHHQGISFLNPIAVPLLSSTEEINSPIASYIFFSTFIFPFSVFLEPLAPSDNTARILTRRSGFRQQEQSVFYLPILIADSGQPALSSTGTLTIQVCSCDDDGHVMSCSPEAYMLPVSLSRGALIAILACIFVLLGKTVTTTSQLSYPELVFHSMLTEKGGRVELRRKVQKLKTSLPSRPLWYIYL
jgi:hypothetical protein